MADSDIGVESHQLGVLDVDLVCLGEPLFEFNQMAVGGDYCPGFGGDVSNCAIAAARQGARVAMATAVGQDSFGDAFIKLWQDEGIHTAAVRRHDSAPTGLYFISHGPEGHQFDYRRAGSAASLMGPEDLPREVLTCSRFLHVSAISQAIGPAPKDAVFSAMETVRNVGGRVAYDTNLRLKLWPLACAQTVIGEALAMCDIALPGIDDARLLTGREDVDHILDYFLEKGAGIVALTLGSDGVALATPAERHRISGQKVAAVDATAAGDTFDGAFLAELARGNDAVAAATFANAAAALSTMGYGGVAPIPSRTAVEAFLAAGGR
jgi:2-dehydro-3-deoxygluconokinase